MSDWHSAQELAGLPGMPGTPQRVNARARSEGWTFRPRAARGGGREYATASLPTATREALLARSLQSSLIEVAQRSTVPPVTRSPCDLTDTERLVRDARTGVLAALTRLQADSGCTRAAAITTLLTQARAGRLDPPLDRMLRLARDTRGRSGDGYPSDRTLKRWLADHDLAPKHRRPTDRVPPWAQHFLAYWQQPQKPSVEEAYRQFAAVTPSNQRPSIHQVRRFLTRLGTLTRQTGRMGPRELKTIRPFVRRDFSALQPNDVWSADGHTFDAEVQHPLHGRPFRPEITTFVDIATRRAVGWSVDLAESAIAVADALRHAVQHEGIPALIYVDNGSGYRNASLNNEATGLIGRIGATLTHSLPYNSQARGVIERLHQTLWVTGAKALPSYIGAAMDREARLHQFKLTRRALKQGGAIPLMPWHLFVEWVQQRVSEYNGRPHRSLRGRSPDQILAEHRAAGWTPEHLTPAEISTLFRPRVKRTLARAEIRLFNNIYFAGDLEEFHGTEVHVAYDIHDVSQVWVHLPDGRLLATAHINGNAKHYFPVPVVEQARQQRAQGRLARLDTKRQEVLDELHGSPALTVAPAATLVISGRIVQPEAALATRPQIATATTVEPPSVPPARSDRSAADNYADWLAIDARITAGQPVPQADAYWHASFQRTAQFRSIHKKKAAG